MKQLLSLSLKTVALIGALFLLGFTLSYAYDRPDAAFIVGFVFSLLAFVPKSKGFKSQLNFITATDIVAEWGLLYRNQGQKLTDIMSRLRQKTVTSKYFPMRTTDQTVMEKASSSTTSVLQRFQKAFTPKGGVTFEPLAIHLMKLKIDLAEYPDELEETWLGFLADNSLKRKDWPFVKWYLYEMGFKQLDADRENNEIYKGVPGVITPGTATADGTNLLGIKKQINTFDADGTLAKIVMGAMPTDPLLVVEYVEDFYKQVPRVIKNELDFGFVQEDVHDLFRDGMRLKYNAQYKDVDDSKLTKLRNDNISLVGLPSMAGSNKIWTTPVWNRQGGIKKPKNPSIFEVENVDRQVKAYTDWYEAYGFWVPQYLYSNDVELV